MAKLPKHIQDALDVENRKATAVRREWEHTYAARRLKDAGHHKAARKHANQSSFWGAIVGKLLGN
jgi:hypothetical protein